MYLKFETCENSKLFTDLYKHESENCQQVYEKWKFRNVTAN